MRVQMTAEQQAWLKRSTSELGLCTRTVNALELIKVYTVEDLLMCRPEDLLAQANFGTKTLKEVYDALATVGFYVGGKPPEKVEAPQPPAKVKPVFPPTTIKFRKLRSSKHQRDPLHVDETP